MLQRRIARRHTRESVTWKPRTVSAISSPYQARRHPKSSVAAQSWASIGLLAMSSSSQALRLRAQVSKQRKNDRETGGRFPASFWRSVLLSFWIGLPCFASTKVEGRKERPRRSRDREGDGGHTAVGLFSSRARSGAVFIVGEWELARGGAATQGRHDEAAVPPLPAPAHHPRVVASGDGDKFGLESPHSNDSSRPGVPSFDRKLLDRL